MEAVLHLLTHMLVQPATNVTVQVRIRTNSTNAVSTVHMTASWEALLCSCFAFTDHDACWLNQKIQEKEKEKKEKRYNYVCNSEAFHSAHMTVKDSVLYSPNTALHKLSAAAAEQHARPMWSRNALLHHSAARLTASMVQVECFD